MKKILILGGRPIGSVELTKRCQERGLFTIVSDYLSVDNSPAKRIADESWNISTNEVDVLVEKCLEEKVDGVLTAVHEFNIRRMLDLCEKLNLPCYCNKNTWKYCDSKLEFKKLCYDSGIEVAQKYDFNTAVNQLEKSSNPFIVKPVDSSGSRGFSICKTSQELESAIERAKQFSLTGQIVIEDYIPYDAVIIYYTMHHGKCYFSGITDKYSARFPSTGASVMGLQLIPSKGLQQYLDLVDGKARLMFENAGFTDGPIWIEAFYDGDKRFVFNEMGYRFGGSMTNYPVKYFYQIDQMDLLIDIAIGERKNELSFVPRETKKKYCILPIHLHSGRIAAIEGLDKLYQDTAINAIAQVHYIGDDIKEWGSAQQVFCYVHILFDDATQLKNKIDDILQVLQVKDDKGHNMLFTLYDINLIQGLC